MFQPISKIICQNGNIPHGASYWRPELPTIVLFMIWRLHYTTRDTPDTRYTQSFKGILHQPKSPNFVVLIIINSNTFKGPTWNTLENFRMEP